MKEKFLPDAFVGTKAVVAHNQKVLLLKRSEKLKQNPGQWGLPGGRLERGEQPAEGVVREIEEETKLKVSDLKLFEARSYETDDGMAIVIFYVAKTDSSEVGLDWENDDYRWIDIGEIEGFDADDAVKELAKLGAKQLGLI